MVRQNRRANLEALSIPLESCASGKVGDTEVAIFNVDGQLYATQANCTHRGGPLCQGGLWGEIVTCPWHGSEFDVRTGEVKAGPATEPLKTYPLSVQNGEVVVEI